jgi:tetratricopeptide (TPR) repeat protein
MTATANTLRSSLARVRAVAERRLRPPSSPMTPPPPPAVPSVLNLVPDPGFRGEPDRPFDAGGLYVHSHNSCEFADVPGRPGVRGARVEGVGANNDTHIAPGGRNAAGAFRLGMRPGHTYTAGVSVYLPEPLTGTLHPAALRLVPGCVVDDAVDWAVARSAPARNEFGHHRISVTFTVPADATAAWIRLHSGMSAGHGVVYWYDYALTETDVALDHFDGSTPAGDFHVFAWTGEPNASPSRRTVRIGRAATSAEIAAEAVRLARAGVTEESRYLRGHFTGERLAVARIALAEGDRAAAVEALDEVVEAGDPDGAAAYELGRLALTEHRWAAAEKQLRTAVTKRPEDYERGYALAFAYDKLRRRDDSKRTSAAALVHDTKLPFDGPAVLDMDVTSFGARRELGVFLAGNLGRIRTQAEHRLARPVASTFDQPIFIYWAQGFEQAPPVVRTCLAALKATNPDSRVHELTDANLSGYVDVPDGLLDAIGGNRTHFSDLLRLLLLEKFGGIWVDATCLVSEPLRPRVTRALERSSVFAFNYTGPYISSWFLAARPGSYVVHLWRAACFLWWEKRGELVDYFLMHHVFEMLYHLDDRFRADWDAGTRLNSKPPHALQEVMLQAYDPDMYQTVMEGAFAHKLRYKFQAHELQSESYLARIIRGDLP